MKYSAPTIALIVVIPIAIVGCAVTHAGIEYVAAIGAFGTIAAGLLRPAISKESDQ